MIFVLMGYVINDFLYFCITKTATSMIAVFGCFSKPFFVDFVCFCLLSSETSEMICQQTIISE
jgi:hypothetical protein